MKTKQKNTLLRPLIAITVVLVATGSAYIANLTLTKQTSIEEKLELTALAIKIFSVRHDRIPSDLAEVSGYRFNIEGLEDFNNVDISDIEYKATDRFNSIKKFTLCANFANDTTEDNQAILMSAWTNFGHIESSGTLNLNNNYYQHPKGNHCFNEESVSTSHLYKNGNVELKLRPR